ncbi:MAG: hypothetical protein Q8N51_03735, partial [Gammaproteobacteria bacterium]|nr:hypothetical protein [Gammaproteobacteria bacterium]
MTATEKGAPVKSLLRIVLLATLGLGLLASPVAAGSYKRVIKPGQLLPVLAQEKSGRTSAFVHGVGSSWTYYSCPLTIPTGKIITGLSFQHAATGATIATVELAASNPGQTPASVVVYQATSQTLGASADFITIPGSFTPGLS